MSWDQNYDNSGYGNYDNSAYGNYGGFEQPQQTPQTNAYDPYASAGQPPPGSDPYAQMPPQNQGGFYNPNDYMQQAKPAPSQIPPTSSTYGHAPQVAPPPQQQPPPPQQQFGFSGLGDQMNPMVANMAMQYGQEFMGKGQEQIKENLEKYVSIGQLKYYFAVDTSYVGKKLGLLLFPFGHKDWSVKYNQDAPVQPKFDVNAPDLYIPSMAYVTYVLIVGYILGLRNAFSPDQLATTASSALVWLILEIGCIYLSLTLMNINTSLCKWDVLSFSTYKYVGTIAVLLIGLLVGSTQVYYASLLYVSGALAFFLVRTLKLRIEPEVHGMQSHGKRKLYMILFYAGLQPLIIWWMTSYFVPIVGPEMPGMPPETDSAVPVP